MHLLPGGLLCIPSAARGLCPSPSQGSGIDCNPGPGIDPQAWSDRGKRRERH